MKKIYCIVFLILLNSLVYGQKTVYYDNNSRIREAHRAILSLKTNSAENLLRQEERINPNNVWVTFYRLYSRIIFLFISNSPEEYKKSASILEDLVEKIEESPSNTPDHLYLAGEAKIYLGLLKVKYANKLTGLLEFLKGYKWIENNRKEHPDYGPNLEILGITHVGTSFIPRGLQFAIKVLGIKGDPVMGLRELTEFSSYAKGKPGMEEESMLMTVAAYKVMGQDESLVKFIRSRMNEFREVALLNYLAATISLESNQGELALELLSHIPGRIEVVFPPVFYLTGKAKLYRLDPDTPTPLYHYLQLNTGPDFIKATWFNLACFAAAFNKINEYRQAIKEVQSKGREMTNRDMEATYEAEKNIFPDPGLTRAWLLIRGGYLNRAEDELSQIRIPGILPPNQQVRYYLLQGEFHRLSNNPLQAEVNCRKAISLGKEKDEDGAQEALIQCGLMKEKMGQKQEAEYYYKECLRFRSNKSPYADVFVNKARSGIIRLSQK